MPVIISYVTGTGGDHVIRMLDGSEQVFHGKRVLNDRSLKFKYFQSLFHPVDAEQYQQEYQYLLTQGINIIGAHDTVITDPNAVKIVLTWSDPVLTHQFVCRDIIVNDFDAEYVSKVWPSNSLVWRVFEYPSQVLSDRGKVIRFAKFAMKQLGIFENHCVPSDWQGFNIDRIFHMDFVKDIEILGRQLNLDLDTKVLESKQKAWLDQNPNQAFNFRNAVRALESREWVKQRLS